MSFPQQQVATFPENWPAGLRLLAPPMESLALSPDDVKVLGSYSAIYRAQCGDFRQIGLSETLLEAIGDAVSRFPEGVMPRLGYGSWKDSTVLNRPARTLADVMQTVTADDPRIGQALAVHTISGDPVVLHLRAWRDIPPWGEFRVFLWGGRVLGVSQYLWGERFPEIAAQDGAIRAAIRAFLAALTVESHMPDVVVDLFVAPDERSDGALRATLIELNPLDSRTDACLYSWAGGGDFDRGFRYNRAISA